MSRFKNYMSSDSAAYIRLLLRLCLLTGLLFCSTALAKGLDSLQVHGFASQAFISTTNNNFFGDTDGNGHFEYSELGLNVSARPVTNLQISGQLLSRRAGESDGGGVRLDYGLADYTVSANIDNRWGIRAGRILNPLGFYNETRDVSFTRPSIFLPQSIYFDRTRDLAISSDGFQLYGEHRAGTHEFIVEFGMARPRVSDLEIERALLGGNRPGQLDAELSYLGRILWEQNGGMIRMAFSAASVNIGYDPAILDLFANGDITFTPYIFSAQFNQEKWSLTTEYARRNFDFAQFGPFLPDTSITGESGYAQLTYRFAPRWDLLLRYDALFTDKDDRHGKLFASLTGLPAYTRFAKDKTIGLGWHVTDSILLRTEFHNIDGTAWLPAEDNPNPSATKSDWNMFAVQASYRF